MKPNSKDTSDTMSEISETSTADTGRSCCSNDCREELQNLAASLGLISSDELHKDRFRVDRKKLENMLLGNSENASSAHDFFKKIMNETKTLILWPSRLKIGAKSKKDPHIKIAGLIDHVAIAKQRVMNILDTRSNRVTMKLDVSYTDHSHIIGKGGLRIKRVMEETNCHIHFPDSNRNNQEEKSNQVSIAGEMAAIEKARARLRELTPLIFCFELPNISTMRNFPELTSPFIVSVQETYNVQVMFRNRTKLHSTLVMVKGCEWEVTRVKEATIHLIEHMCDVFANQVSVQMMMEISPQYHGLVLGAGHQNLKTIMQQTAVQVLFPDANDPNTPSLKKSSVSITGAIHNVYLARQMLLGSLPLILMFDMMPESVTLNAGVLEEIMHSLDVYISIRHKPKQNIFSIVIKGLERNAGNIYEARRRLLNCKEKSITADIPSNYAVSANVPTFLRTFSVGSSIHGIPNILIGNGTTGSNLPPPQSPRSPAIFHPLFQQISNEIGFGSLLNSPQMMANSPHHLHPSTAATAAAMMLQQRFNRQATTAGLVNGGTTDIQQPLGQLPYSSYTNTSIDGKDYPPYSSLSSTTSSLSSPGASPRTASPSHGLSLDMNEVPERRAPGFERSVANFNLDIHQMRIQATQAMQREPVKSQVQVPNSCWSGYGFSQSSPSAIFREHKQDRIPNTDEELSGNSNCCEEQKCECTSFSASNYLDSTSSSTMNAVISANYSDLPSNLTSLGLQKYIQLFKSHEIDLSTFQTLTEADLREIGVTALGARRKLLLFIAELKKREYVSIFRGSAAPGAERKSVSPRNDTTW